MVWINCLCMDGVVEWKSRILREEYRNLWWNITTLFNYRGDLRKELKYSLECLLSVMTWSASLQTGRFAYTEAESLGKLSYPSRLIKCHCTSLWNSLLLSAGEHSHAWSQAGGGVWWIGGDNSPEETGHCCQDQRIQGTVSLYLHHRDRLGWPEL